VTTRLTNSLRGNYSLQDVPAIFKSDSFGGATPPDPALLIPPPLSPTTAFAFFSLGGAGAYQLGKSSEVRETQVNLVNDVSFSTGSHQLKFGTNYVRLALSLGAEPGALDYFSLGVQDFASTGAASFLLGFVGRHAKMLLHQLSFYVQDSWHIGPRLTVTYGLRWELDPAPSAQNGTILASWRNVDNPVTLSLAPVGTPPWKTTYGNVAPRLGLAYRITSRGDFVARGGWGIFYDLGTGTVSDLNSLFPNTTSSFNSGPISLPIVNPTQYLPTLSVQPPFSSEVEGFSPDLRLPRSYQWNLAIEKSFLGTQALSMTYVGQHAQDLLRREFILPPSSNPNFSLGAAFSLTRNADSSDYHALQVQYRRPLSRGMQALVNYTWSHSIDTGSDDSAFLNSHLIISGAGDRGSSSFDIRHNFTGAITYDVPHFARETILSALTRNWSIDTVVDARTGLPIDVVTSSVAIPGISAPTRADLVPGTPIWLSGPYPGGKKLNFDAFAIPQQLRQGTLGRNAITGFGLTQVDLSAARKFNLTERISLQFRSDFFNLFNHPNFGNPNNSLDSGRSFFGLATGMLDNALNPSGVGGLNRLYQIGGPRSVQLSLKLIF